MGGGNATQQKSQRFKPLLLFGIITLILFLSLILAYTVFDNLDLNSSKLGNGYILNINNSNSPYNNLIYYFPFDTDTSTNSYDISNNHYVSTLTGVSSVNFGIYGNSLNCSGGTTGKHSTSFDMANMNESFSFSFWIYNRQNPINYGGIIMQRSSSPYGLWMYQTANSTSLSTYWYYNSTYNINYGTTAAFDTWTYFMYIRDKTNSRFYVYKNGVLATNVSDPTVPYNFAVGTTSQSICLQSSNGGQEYLDEIMLFNTSLTGAQVSDIYNNQSNRFVSNSTVYKSINLLTGSEFDGMINVTNSYLLIKNSSILVSGSYYNGSWYNLTSQNISSSNNFTISNSSTQVNITYTLISSTMFSPVLYESNISYNIVPSINLSGFIDGGVYNSTDTLNISCYAVSNNTLENITLYSNISGTVSQVNSYETGIFGESSTGSNITVSFNAPMPNEPVRTGVINITTSDPFTAPSSYNETTLFDNSEGGYAQLWVDNTLYPSFARPIWFKFRLNTTYAINKFYQYTYSSTDFRCTDYDVAISLNDLAYTTVASIRGVNALTYTNSFNETIGQYVKLTCYNRSNSTVSYYPSWGEIKIYGKLLTSEVNNYATANFTTLVSSLTNSNNTNVSLYCKEYDKAGASYTSNILTFFSPSTPSITNIFVNPNNILIGTNFSVNCNASDVSTTNLNVTVEYRDNSTSNWVSSTTTKINPYLIYSHGDSISAGNVWQGYLDTYMGSNASAVNASNSSQKLYNFAIGGWTCSQVEGNFNTTVGNNSVAIILCGINGYAQLTNEPIMERIQQAAIAKNVSLIWVSILTATNASLYVDTTIPSKIYTINEWLRTNLTVRYNSTFVDAHRAIWNGTYGFCRPDLCNADGLHPSTAGYQVLAQAIWAQGFKYQKFNMYWATQNVSTNLSGKYLDVRCKANNGYRDSSYLYSNGSLYVNDTVSPNATLIFPTNNTHNSTTSQNFTANLTDDVGLQNATLYIYNSSNSIVNQTTINSISGTLQSVVGVVVNLVEGIYNWFYQVFDTSGNSFITQNNTLTIETTYPQFSNNLTNIANGSEYNPGNNYQFNITITNANGTAGIQFNGTNYTLNNVSSSFYWNAGNLAVGTYSYYFWSYGNGLLNLFNSSQIYSYVIAQNSSYNLSITGTTPIIYGSAAGISNSSCPSQINCVLNRNDTGVITSPDNAILSVGYYNYTFNTTGNANYSAKSTSFILQVNQANSLVYTYLNNSRSNITIMNGTAIWLNATRQTGEGTINLYNNGTLINSGSSPLSNLTNFTNLGLFNITAIYPATQNYSASSETWWVNVTNITSTPAPYCGDATCNNGETCSSCAGDCGSCGGGGSGGGTFVRTPWDTTYSNDYKELKNLPPVLQSLEEKQRVSILVDSETHFVGVTDITNDKVTVNVSSNNSKQAVLSPGQSAKFEINNDSYYDIKVLLNNIYKILGTNKANLTITYIHEKMPDNLIDNETALIQNSSNNNSTINVSNDNSNKCGIGQGENLGVCIKNIFGNPFLLFVTFLVIFIIWAVYKEFYKKKKY